MIKGRLRRALTTALLFILPTVGLAQPDQKPLGRGTVIKRVVCQADSSMSYALYLPSDYTPSRRWPTIYAFDPVARGALPVKLLAEAAERFGYIVLGSNNARNGPWEPNFAALNAMSSDIAGRLAIDFGRIYTTGFSGGARLASVVARLTGTIRGVILCGAGFPTELPPRADQSFAVYAIVGETDMNNLELHTLRNRLVKLDYPVRLEVFEGGHRWPNPEAFEDALQWLELQAMRSGEKNKNDDFIQSRFERAMTQAKILDQDGRVTAAYKRYNQIAGDFNGLVDINEVEEEIELLRYTKLVKDSLKLEQKIRDEERDLMQKFGQKLHSLDTLAYHKKGEFKNLDWWQNELDKLQDRIEGGPTRAGRAMAERVFESIWRHCAEGVTVFAGDYGPARMLMLAELWCMAQPERPFPRYTLASLYARAGRDDEALAALQKAAELGFQGVRRLDDDDNLASLRETQQYRSAREAILVNKARQEKETSRL